MIKIPEFVKNLIIYRAGKPIEELAREKNLKRIVKLASGENPIGPSPKALEAIRESLLNLNRYTDPASHELVMAIAEKYNIQSNHIICGHGTDSLLAYIVSAFTNESDEILSSEGTFIGIYVNINKLGRKLIKVPLKNYAFDLEEILNHINEKTTMIYLANPNNPTGTMFERDEFEAFMDKVPDDIMVILDEAYTTYASENPKYPNGLRYDYENMVVTRTLSKAYGLAGLRIGFAAGPDNVIESLYKVKLPFEPNLLAQKAAIAALDDDDFLKETVELNKKSLYMMRNRFRQIGIKQIDTWSNFILLIMPSESFALEFTRECLDLGLILRHVIHFGIPNGVRINSGTIDETEFALDIIATVYKKLIDELKTSSVL